MAAEDHPVRACALIVGSRAMCSVDLPALRPTALNVDYHRHAGLPSCVTPVNTLTYYRIRSQPGRPASPKGVPGCPGAECHRGRYGRFFAGTGISTRRPSTTPVGLALGPDLPRADEPGPGTLGHSADGFLTRHSLLMPAFSLVWRPPLGHPAASPATRRSPTHPHTWTRRPGRRVDATASAVRLSPATLSARNHLTSELLRTLSRVAASKPTSWLSVQLHILSHLAHA